MLTGMRPDHTRPETHLTRRAFLGVSTASLGLTLAACTGQGDGGPSTGGSGAGDEAVVLAALMGELTLLSAYDAALRQSPSLAGVLEPLRAQHAAHAQALRAQRAVTEPTRIPEITVPGAPAGAIAALRRAEQDAATARTASCVEAADPSLARTLALIAASEASHAAALTDAGAM